MKQEKYISDILDAGFKAAYAQLHQDKNIEKSEFTVDLEDLYDDLFEEMIELHTAIANHEGSKRIIEEAGDVINFASAIAYNARYLVKQNAMKVFISQPMKGRSQEQILQERKQGMEYVKSLYPNQDIVFLDTYFKDFDGNRLEFLGKSISEGLAKADKALFLGDYEHFDGCACEHTIALRYNIPTMYFALLGD